MQIIRHNAEEDISGTVSRYYDLSDVRVIDLRHYPDGEDEKWHRHYVITEILFVIEGTIEVQTEKETKMAFQDEIVIFYPEEWHRVIPLTDETRILVFKYMSNNTNCIKLIKDDWEAKKC